MAFHRTANLPSLRTYPHLTKQLPITSLHNLWIFLTLRNEPIRKTELGQQRSELVPEPSETAPPHGFHTLPLLGSSWRRLIRRGNGDGSGGGSRSDRGGGRGGWPFKSKKFLDLFQQHLQARISVTCWGRRRRVISDDCGRPRHPDRRNPCSAVLL